jgi:hypothetical protein
MMISVCGVICSDCPAFDGAAKGPAHQQRTVEAWSRIYALSETAEHIACAGCLGPDDDLFYTSRNCVARRCCLARGYGSCAQCPAASGARDLAMPAGSRFARPDCPDLEKAQSAWDEVPGLIDRLSAADFKEYARPYCDHRVRLAALRDAFQGQQHDRILKNRSKPNQT